MGAEIERKFLVEHLPDGLQARSGTLIAQGYLAIDPEAEVRLRRAGDDFTLTVKNGHGEARQETEVDLDQETFEELWPESIGRRIEKLRRKIDLDGGLVAEVDTYSGDLEGFAVVEVEFESEAAAVTFRPPAWFGRELTGDGAWANQSLAVSGPPERRLEFRLRPGEAPETGICRVIAARTSQAAAAVRRAGEAERSAEHVHEARKSLKKARSAIRLLRGVIPDEERRETNDACREAGRRLSGARDAEVKVETLRAVAGEVDLDGAGDWKEKLEIEAETHRGDLNRGELASVEGLIESTARAFRGHEPSGMSEAVAGNVGRSYRRGRKAMKQARRSEHPDQLHEWRKRAKDLRYQLEILEPRLPGRFTAVRKKAKKLADLLGDLHDLDVLAEDLEGRDLEEADRGVLRELISETRDRQLEACLDLGAKTYGLKPKRVTNLIAEVLADEN